MPGFVPRTFAVTPLTPTIFSIIIPSSKIKLLLNLAANDSEDIGKYPAHNETGYYVAEIEAVSTFMNLDSVLFQHSFLLFFSGLSCFGIKLH
jgi:hypothetical protein